MPQVRYVAYGEGPEAAGGGAVCSVEELSLQARPATLGLQPCVSSLLPVCLLPHYYYYYCCCRSTPRWGGRVSTARAARTSLFNPNPDPNLNPNPNPNPDPNLNPNPNPDPNQARTSRCSRCSAGGCSSTSRRQMHSARASRTGRSTCAQATASSRRHGAAHSRRGWPSYQQWRARTSTRRYTGDPMHPRLWPCAPRLQPCNPMCVPGASELRCARGHALRRRALGPVARGCAPRCDGRLLGRRCARGHLPRLRRGLPRLVRLHACPTCK